MVGYAGDPRGLARPARVNQTKGGVPAFSGDLPAGAPASLGNPVAPAAPTGARAPSAPTSLGFSQNGFVNPFAWNGAGAGVGGFQTQMPASTPRASTGTNLQKSNFGTDLSPGNPTQAPGNNFTNPGYTEQAFDYTQNRLLEDPAQAFLTNAANGTKTPSGGENYLNHNLGTLDGPGQGDQYWNQVQGQFNTPMAGEQFARQATQNMNPQGPASAFYNNAMGQYDQFTNNQGPQNTQGQYGQTSAQLANGTQGEQGLGQIAGQYGNLGQYSGPNNAQGQYQQNAASGPLAAQSYYNQVAGQQGTKGTYSDPNLAAGQYAQTQGAFGDMPLPNSADAYYDRAIQLGTQSYNQGAASRGVYGSSQALSGVGNVITDLNAQRAQNEFGNQMAINQEQRARQELLGNQARMGDLSSLSAFGANLSGLETFGNLANQAGNQTLQQQTMLGSQARNADISQSEAFNNNLAGASTFANINNQLGAQELDRSRLLGDLANNADSQAARVQEGNLAGVNAFGNLANSADSAETNRYNATTSAMNNADRTGIDRMTAGANIANNVDANSRADYTASNNAAQQAANTGMDRTRLGADLMNTASQNDLNRLNAFNDTANSAENSRQSRNTTAVNAISGYSKQVQSTISNALSDFIDKGQGDWENYAQASLVPELQKAGLDQKQIDQVLSAAEAVIKAKNPG
jgi:hypothetical protein